MMYALRPPRPPARAMPSVTAIRRDYNLLQFSFGWNVAPDPRVLVRLTARFRGAVIQELIRIKTGDPKANWGRAGTGIRGAIADMTGKDSEGKPLMEFHRHAEFLAWFEDGVATRLLVWRDGRPFDEDEQRSILLAASRELSWADEGPDADAWKVKLVPLDSAVPPPPGFDNAPARVWESVTPYVPPRHYLRRGKLRARETIDAQICRELVLRDVGHGEQVEVQQLNGPSWIAVHVPRGKVTKQPFIGYRRGYWIRLTFQQPVKGPLRLGHSSSFGVGLFRPT